VNLAAVPVIMFWGWDFPWLADRDALQFGAPLFLRVRRDSYIRRGS
jgi:hypothetical protein